MYIKFGWGRNLSKDDLKYTATDFNVSLSSSEEYGIGLGNCLPGQININLEVEPSYQHKPATDILKFAKNQHDIAKTEGAGKIVVYPEEDVGQATQEIEFKDAWIADLVSGGTMRDRAFTLRLSIVAGNIKMSDVEFVDQRRTKLLTPSKA
jgi:hypothetical protein